MSVPAGYKATEVGLIPEDWDAVSLGALFTFKNGLNKAKQFFGHGTPIVNYMDVYRFPALRAAMVVGRVDVNKTELENYSVRRGDVFFTRTSETVEEVGIASAMLDEANDTVFSGFVLRARPKSDDLIDHFKAYAFRSETVRNQIVAKATYTTRALTNGGALSAIFLAKPPKPEQTAIAEALADMDEAIAAVEAVIAKTLALKTATMQALLSGTRRLPGFSGEWKRHTFGQLFQFLRNGNSARATLSANGAIGYIHYGDIHAAARAHMDCSKGALPRIARELVNRLPRVQNGDLLIADASEDYEGTGKSVEATYIGDDEVVAGLHTLLLRPVNKMASGFAGYLQFIPEVKRQYIAAAQGVSVYGLSRSAVKAVEVAIPQYEEQEAISSCLIDMEIDLSHQTDNLNKLRRLKIGMMQQLLTGKIRLT